MVEEAHGGGGARCPFLLCLRTRKKGTGEVGWARRRGDGPEVGSSQEGFLFPSLKFYFSFSSFSVFVFLKQNRKEFLIKKLYKIGLV